MQQIRDQLESVCKALDGEKRKSSKFEVNRCEILRFNSYLFWVFFFPAQAPPKSEQARKIS